MARFAIDALTSFSIKPLRLATWLGFLSAFFAFGLMAYSSVRWAIGEVVDGWTSLIMAVAAFAAVQLIVLGILGEYVGRLVLESKRRPLFIVDTVLRATSLQAITEAPDAPPAADVGQPR